MPARTRLHFDIADRQMEHRDGVAPDDLVLLRRDTPHDLAAYPLAYCADLQSERVIYTLHDRDDAMMAQAPFLYAAQLQAASGAMTIPFEQLDDAANFYAPGCAAGYAPTLIFSPGRTGSTLLARLLAACGVPCASEPDMPTQICRFEREDRMRIGLDMEAALHRAALGSLCAWLGPKAFIKLRSQCNARPLPLLQAAADAPAVFMLRQVESWARSRHRAFAEPPVSVAAVLRQAVDALDKLLGAARTLHIVWFEKLREDPAAELRRLLPDGQVDAAAVATMMARDAQAGTSLERVRLHGSPMDPGFDEAFAQAWRESRAGAAWSGATKALLAAMQAD